MILVFLGVFVVTVAIYPNFNFTQSSEARFSGSKVPKIENNNIILPFSPTEDFVKGFEIFYSYNTVITGFKEIDSGKEILTTINDFVVGHNKFSIFFNNALNKEIAKPRMQNGQLNNNHCTQSFY